MGFSCKILADSVFVTRLTTFEITFPRCILAELNTHRMLSRNAASSRAIPTERLIQRVLDDPFIPDFRMNKRGMQAGDRIEDVESAENQWLLSRDQAVRDARFLHGLNIHKQYVNRLMEPWMWATVIVSGTDWYNFFKLRCHPDAEPSFQKIATMMRDEMENSAPVELGSDEWHLPLIDEEDYEEVFGKHPGNYLKSTEELCMISAGRCARVSYLTHDGRRDIEEDVTLAKRLALSGHWSPFEHQAIPSKGRHGNFNGWNQFRKFFKNEGWQE